MADASRRTLAVRPRPTHTHTCTKAPFVQLCYNIYIYYIILYIYTTMRNFPSRSFGTSQEVSLDCHISGPHKHAVPFQAGCDVSLRG